MATYKVPQDVEADDKLLGPFSFRQFIYLVIVAAAVAVGWGLSQIFIGLAVAVLPIILFFGALALPLRKDQPMETYLAAIVSFYLKPRRRLWDPDGLDTLIEIIAPKTVEVQRTKNLSESEAERRLSYLANIVDTEGWAVRGVVMAPVTAPNSPMNTDMYYEAQQAEDVLDASGRTATLINDQLTQTSSRHRQELVERMQQQSSQPAMGSQQPTTTSVPIAMPDPYQNLAPVTPAPLAQPHEPPTSVIHSDSTLHSFEEFSNMTIAPAQAAADDPTIRPEAATPYPTMSQSILQPLTPQQPALQQSPQSEPPIVKEETPSAEALSPDIISLANNTDLSVETIANEARRIEKKKKSHADDEVVISLR